MEKSLVGRKFNRLTVTKFHHRNKWGVKYWECLCDCGKEKVVAGANLYSGNTKSCGCYKSEKSRERLRDITGQQFGRLVAVRREGTDKVGHAKWRCKCECGEEIIVLGTNLVEGITKSCGCYSAEMRHTFHHIHGKSHTKLWNLHQQIIARCKNENSPNWPHYGGRGISVCDEWKDSFEVFYEWAKDKYKPGLEIDREDNDGNYCPENCRFVGKSLNIINRRKQSNNASGYIGVCFHRQQKNWISYIGYEVMSKKQILLGHFPDKHSAVEARNAFIKEHNLPHKIQEVDLSI